MHVIVYMKNYQLLRSLINDKRGKKDIKLLEDRVITIGCVNVIFSLGIKQLILQPT